MTAAMILLAATPLHAQRIPRSQEAYARQKVANTWLEVHYRRPVARGRTGLFGSVVKWGETWTPGADSATTLTISTAIQVEDQQLPAGSYSIWMQPDSAGAWTVIFNKRARAFHLDYPGEAQDQLRLHVAPQQGPHVESLMWFFPSVDGTEATLTMQWGTTAIPLRIHIAEP